MALLANSRAFLLAVLVGCVAPACTGLQVRAAVQRRRVSTCEYIAGVYVDEITAADTMVRQTGCEVTVESPMARLTGTVHGRNLALVQASFGGMPMTGVLDSTTGVLSISGGLITLEKKCGLLSGKFVDNTATARFFESVQTGCQASVTLVNRGSEAAWTGTVGLDSVLLSNGSRGTIDHSGGIAFASGLYLGACEHIAGSYSVGRGGYAEITQRACKVNITGEIGSSGAVGENSKGNMPWLMASLVSNKLRSSWGHEDMVGTVGEEGDVAFNNGLHLHRLPSNMPVAGEAQGDPHLTNIQGEKFDVSHPGTYTLLQLPKGASTGETSLLTIKAHAESYGPTVCTNALVLELKFYGEWVKEWLHQKQTPLHPGGKHQPVTLAAGSVPGQQDLRLHGVLVRVLPVATESGIQHLNLEVSNLAQVGIRIGGLLGEDSHTSVAENPWCDAALLQEIDSKVARVGSTLAASLLPLPA